MSTGTPYIGSKISLVSKAKIRYEGFLYTIDQNESTVTLAKVKSLGTEDRCPNDPVPAREEIFEYIVFRGHDIDDLHVSEAPKQQQQMSDPAIAHSGPIQQTQNYPNHPNQFPSYGPFGGMPNMGYPQFPNRQHESLGNRQTPPMLPRTPTPEPPKTNVHDERSQKEQKSRSDSNRSNDRKNSSEFRNKGGDRPNDNHHRYNKDNRRDNRDSRNYRDNRDTDKKERGDNKKEHNKDNRYISRDNNTKDQRKDDRERREHGDKNERNSTDRRRGGAIRGRGNRGSNRQSRGGNTREKFTEDFDFETSNAKFNKEEIEKELLKAINKVKIEDDQPQEETKVEEKDQDDSAPLPSPDQFYDRSKSFFDNISCEAMGGKAAPQKPADETGVMTRRQERSLNMETFGQTAGYYRRGGYRGRGNRGGRGRGRGRGGYRGRGNYNRGSSNRNWVDYEFDYEAAGIKSQQAKTKAGS